MTLDAPINVVITTDGLDIDITWDAVTGANSYNVYRSTDPMAADWGTPVANVGGIVYTEAATGTQYFYKVTASSTAPVILGHPTVITPQFNSSKKVKK
jgi:fibronectin type 3 domain-containing protein